MRKLTITIALMLVVALAVPALGAGHGSFSDVPSDHWAYDAINSLVAAGVVEGYPDGEYKGQESMTRYEMAVMVSRALDNIMAEQEAMAEGLTEGQADDVTAIVESLMERNMPESLTDQQAEEVADIVEALTFELRAELEVLGADVDALYEDFEALEAKVDAMDVPEDNIEFGVTVETIFEVADYGDNVKEAGRLWADGDALDLDLAEDFGDWEDANVDEADLPSEKRFWQEIGFDVYGNVGDADFHLEVDTLVNVFTEEKSAFGYAEDDESNFAMDTALLTVDYADTTFLVGDHVDASIARYFVDEEDLQGLAVVKNYLDIDWTFLVAGYGEGDEEVGDTGIILNDIDIYGVTASTDMDFGTVTGRAYQARLPEDQLNVLGLAVSNVALTDVVTVGGEVAFTDSTVGFNEESDFLFAVDGEFVVSDELTLTAMFETVGEDFNNWQGDLEEDNNYDLFNVAAAFDLDENNTVSGSYTWVDANQDEDKHTVEVMLDNVYGDFTNYASVEYTMDDDFAEDRDVRVIELGTEYALDDVTTLGAAWVNKDIDDAGTTEINYNYLKGHMNRELSENTVWNVEAKWIDGEYEGDDADSSALTTSLTVSF
ncbi:S-layer homology domain-containing protein [Halanaerobium hydrogeniformans]|uniref:S-layer domain-containing protein n=1 Tax=Halanaerobium hydrogeniformans TaxID=656519 RepID=E4RP80_HALHG|nr:S-layer homology domain-containing protein [Halanaerobium hydrogeniformans]ADQ13905.1 S-layer domain-containing protein [Halanaerobium hydrogeniformans]